MTIYWHDGCDSKCPSTDCNADDKVPLCHGQGQIRWRVCTHPGDWRWWGIWVLEYHPVSDWRWAESEAKYGQPSKELGEIKHQALTGIYVWLWGNLLGGAIQRSDAKKSYQSRFLLERNVVSLGRDQFCWASVIKRNLWPNNLVKL